MTKDHLHIVSDNESVVDSPAPTNVFEFTPETIEELRRKKLIRDSDGLIELEAVQLGEERVGELSDTERALFIEIVHLTSELSDMVRELTARSLDIYAESIRGTATPHDAHRRFLERGDHVFPSAEEAETYFAMQTRFEYVKAYFNYCLRERLGHSRIYGVRRGFVVITSGNKYTLPMDQK